ncbi:DUF4132 domain-containing protein [Aquisphaera insulae]|uniref:DUF4132 domain-containing protein n=1 Tax=Aquisphaera insulae TaxID=2712864 RepID=UPI0013EB0E1C|nr:DUF4132 domain-containing protein [Aquisphaera insulae]
MKSFRERAMEGLLRYHRNDRELENALRYVETGDTAILKAFSPATHRHNSWRGSFGDTIHPAREFDDEDRRAVELLLHLKQLTLLATWLGRSLRDEKADEDFHGLIRSAAESTGVPASLIDTMTASFIPSLIRGVTPNSAGRYVLGMDEARLTRAVKSAPSSSDFHEAFTGLLELLFASAPERVDAVAPLVLASGGVQPVLAEILLRKGKQRFEVLVAGLWREKKKLGESFDLSVRLVAHNPAAFRAEALERTRTCLLNGSDRHRQDDVCLWLIRTYGKDSLDDLIRYFRREELSPYWVGPVADSLQAALGREGLPAFQALAGQSNPGLRLIAAKHLIKARTPEVDAFIRETLSKGLKDSLNQTADSHVDLRAAWIHLIAGWGPATFEDELFALADDRTKSVREGVARAIGKIGESAMPRILPFLSDKKKDRRLWATVALTTLGTAAAAEVLEARLDAETDDDVRDAMLEVLDAARTARGQVVTRSEIEDRAARSEKKLKTSPAPWLDLAALPPLAWSDGTPLGDQLTRYLLYRQSRQKEIVPDIEARHLYPLIERKSGREFAVQLLRGYLGTKLAPAERWIFAVAAMLGDDRIVPPLNRLVQDCAESSRGKMAEYAVQALALLGTDASLTTVDSLALRYRNKQKNIGAAASAAFAEAAARRGVSVDELGDRVVPWLGFEPGKPRMVEASGKSYEVMISPEWKLTYRDVEKNKKVSALPKSAPKEVLAELKSEAALLKDAVKGQKARLENLLVVQHRWPVDRWRELFLEHPVLLPFAMRLVWGSYNAVGELIATFQALEDRSLTTAEDDVYELTGDDNATVGMVHPLELDAETLAAWRTHLADYEIAPPFPQLDRPVIAVKEEDRTTRISRALHGTSLNAMTFRGRAEKLGWVRGSVNDGGSVDAFLKSFPAAKVDAFLGVEGMNVVSGVEDSIRLEDFSFVGSGSVVVRSYTYDRPSDVTDSRLIPFEDVPPIVFSEVMADLSRITGKSGTEEGENS